MGVIPSKAQELARLCQSLRREDIHFFMVTPSKRGLPGQPDLVLVGGTREPIAIWLRRDIASPCNSLQYAQIEKAASRGWTTIIAFGAAEALQEIHTRANRSTRHAPLAV